MSRSRDLEWHEPTAHNPRVPPRSADLLGPAAAAAISSLASRQCQAAVDGVPQRRSYPAATCPGLANGPAAMGAMASTCAARRDRWEGMAVQRGEGRGSLTLQREVAIVPRRPMKVSCSPCPYLT